MDKGREVCFFYSPLFSFVLLKTDRARQAQCHGPLGGYIIGLLTAVTGSELAGGAQEFCPNKKITSPVSMRGYQLRWRAVQQLPLPSIALKAQSLVIHGVFGRGLIHVQWQLMTEHEGREHCIVYWSHALKYADFIAAFRPHFLAG